MRILVTGATGFIGSNITRTLAKAGHEILAHGTGGEIDITGTGAELISAPLDTLTGEMVGHLDALIHQAAITDTGVHDRGRMLHANVEIPRTLFALAVQQGAKRIVYASSTAVYGNLQGPNREDGSVKPLNVYGESKVLLDEFAMSFAAEHPEVKMVGLRYCNVYGPGEAHKGNMASMVYRLAQQMRTGNPKLFKYGEQRREFIYVDDVVEANMKALEAGASTVANCAPGNPSTFNELVTVLNGALGTSRTPEYIDNPHPETYQSDIWCDVSRAKNLLGFEARYDLKAGIAAYLKSGALSA